MTHDTTGDTTAAPTSTPTPVSTTTATTAVGDVITGDVRGTGPAVVFVAGVGPFRAVDPVTTRTAELLADAGVATVVFDRLGRGDSPASGRLDLDRELAAVAAAIDLAGGPAVLCGHSSGCAISLRAVDRGLPVTGLALWEAPLELGAEETRAWAAEIERRMDAGDLEGATEHFMRDMPPEWLAGAKASAGWPAIAASVVSQRADAQALTWAARALADGGLARVEVPLLALTGVDTFPGMPEAAARLADAVPDGTAETLAGAEHSWDPEAMAARLARFVLR
ncbi:MULTISPECIES: alpha/beta fold hydrolase [unclassified Isoptericola]|uniref:alpha/beta fold hydrolase n=1 Tax=unclassified Isoptericola TaxID=2623355 RepID=UPI003662D590